MADGETASTCALVDSAKAPDSSSGYGEPQQVVLATIEDGAPVFIRFRNLTEAGDYLIRAGAVNRDVL